MVASILKKLLLFYFAVFVYFSHVALFHCSARSSFLTVDTCNYGRKDISNFYNNFASKFTPKVVLDFVEALPKPIYDGFVLSGYIAIVAETLLALYYIIKAPFDIIQYILKNVILAIIIIAILIFILNSKDIKDKIDSPILSEIYLSLIHISEPTRQAEISYAVFCLKKKNTSPIPRY
eukprot:TRINITY_DN556_c0_g1_i5.p1 TRINITY_DN556_c0_g1~~TRINITY_DN556_c0_g1_i5.p1  ORF type:complete len:178 (+),score=27.13 TRINITY_DN556_c0_g1_i5:84-617(+)